MIHVRIKRNRSKDIGTITVEGHAGYAEPGKDIVCAAVSGVVFGMLNAIEMLLGCPLDVTQKEDGGFICAEVPSDINHAVYDKLQLLLEGLVTSLKAIAAEHGKYIKVHDQTIRRWT